MKQFGLIFCFLIFSIQSLYSQLKGRITDSEGKPLAFAAVYIKGTTRGTSSNVEGNYELTLEKGKNILVFQYLGFQTREDEIDNSGGLINFDVVLKPSVYNLQEIIVSFNQEDPAYEIIRNAMASRKYYLNQKPNYTCDAYTKGFIKILDAPKKIFGKNVGTMDGNLDTNRQGYVYLSETVSKLTFEKPDHFYEEMISSIISGRDNGFSFNSASSVRFDLYENTNEFGKSIVSPIADNAFSYYKFKLLGTDTSVNSKTYSYRIQMIPKNSSLGCWNGEITIRNEDWSIESVNSFVTGKQVQQELFDTIYLRQLFIPVAGERRYKIQNQVFGFKAGILGIKLEGKFVVVFSDYLLDESIKVGSKNTILKVQEGANEKNKTYWDSIRPVPLTLDEKIDYQLKDSIKFIRETKVYKDSVDKRNNQFEIMDLFFGYQYTNTFEKWNISFGSPLELFHFNPVQGWALGTTLSYNQTIKRKHNTKRIKLEAKIDYGFSEEKFRPELKLNYQFNKKTKAFIEMEGGIGLFEFNGLESSKLFNEVNNLYFKKSFVKLFEKQYANMQYGRDLSNDLQLNTKVEFTRRLNVENHTEYSFSKKSQFYQSNAIADKLDDSLVVAQKELFSWSTHLSWSPATKIWITPDEITKLGTVFPKFVLDYTWGYYSATSSSYHKLGLTITKDFNFGSWGAMSAALKGNSLLYNRELDTPERIYQHGNALAFYIEPHANDYFLTLYPYAYSTSKISASFFMEHDFQGRFLDRIPLINKLRFKELIRFSAVSIPGSNPYSELSLGFGNVGYKLFRLFRVDWVNQFYSRGFQASYLRVGLISSFGAGS